MARQGYENAWVQVSRRNVGELEKQVRLGQGCMSDVRRRQQTQRKSECSKRAYVCASGKMLRGCVTLKAKWGLRRG